MAGGDLLYIFAFIILPTVVLVSCIWALILLRKGVLLPARPARAHEDDISQLDAIADEVGAAGVDAGVDAVDLVEETGEHTIVEPVRPVAPVPVAPASRAIDPAASAPVIDSAVADEPRAATPRANGVPHDRPAVDELPPAERTQELDVVPVTVTDVRGLEVDATAADDVRSVESEPRVVPDDGGAGVAYEAAAPVPAPAGASSVLIVPLDEPMSALRSAAAPVVDDENTEQQDQPSASSLRRPVRRTASLRPADEASPRPRPRAGQRRDARRPGDIEG